MIMLSCYHCFLVTLEGNLINSIYADNELHVR